MILLCYVSEHELNKQVMQPIRFIKEYNYYDYSTNKSDTFLKVINDSDILEQGYHDNYYYSYYLFWAIKPKKLSIVAKLMLYIRKLIW